MGISYYIQFMVLNISGLIAQLIIIRCLLLNTKMDITSRKSNIGSKLFLIGGGGGDIKWKHKNMHLSHFLIIPTFDPFCNTAIYVL